MRDASLFVVRCTNQSQIFLTLLLSLLLGLFISTVYAGNIDDVLVDTQWLIKHQDDPNLIIVDARSEHDYKKGHIRGAVNIPVEDTFNPLIQTDRVGNIKYIAVLFSNAGIRNDHLVVIYDGNSYIDAGRVFWVLEVYGHKKVMLLNGGLEGWQAHSGQALSQKNVELQNSYYVPTMSPHRFVTKFSMRLAVKDKDKLIIDTRSKEDFDGKKSIASRSGHIPSAINIPWTENFIEVDGVRMLKPLDELSSIYDPAIKGKRVILYCNKGKQSSLSYTVLRKLGYDVAHYDGSWFEWGNDSGLPVKSNARKIILEK